MIMTVLSLNRMKIKSLRESHQCARTWAVWLITIIRITKRGNSSSTSWPFGLASYMQTLQHLIPQIDTMAEIKCSMLSFSSWSISLSNLIWAMIFQVVPQIKRQLRIQARFFGGIFRAIFGSTSCLWFHSQGWLISVTEDKIFCIGSKSWESSAAYKVSSKVKSLLLILCSNSGSINLKNS